MSASLNLDTLPSDIIRKIISVGHEAVDGMRLISHRWNDLALDHLVDRKRFPVIKEFGVRNEGDYSSTVFMEVADRYKEYFVKHWPTSSVTTKGWPDETIDASEKLCNNTESVMGSLKRIFPQCSRVERFVLSEFFHHFGLDILAKVMGDVHIEEFAIDHFVFIDQMISTEIVDFIRPRSIRRLVLDFAEFSWNWLKPHVATIYAEASPVVSTIKILTNVKPLRSEAEVHTYWMGEMEELKPTNFIAKVEIKDWPLNTSATLIIERIEH